MPFREIAEVIGRHLDLPVVRIVNGEVADYFDYLTLFAGLDNPASSTVTQVLLDWHPTHPGLIQDLDEGHYFRA